MFRRLPCAHLLSVAAKSGWCKIRRWAWQVAAQWSHWGRLKISMHANAAELHTLIHLWVRVRHAQNRPLISTLASWCFCLSSLEISVVDLFLTGKHTHTDRRLIYVSKDQKQTLFHWDLHFFFGLLPLACPFFPLCCWNRLLCCCSPRECYLRKQKWTISSAQVWQVIVHYVNLDQHFVLCKWLFDFLISVF